METSPEKYENKGHRKLHKCGRSFQLKFIIPQHYKYLLHYNLRSISRQQNFTSNFLPQPPLYKKRNRSGWCASITIKLRGCRSYSYGQIYCNILWFFVHVLISLHFLATKHAVLIEADNNPRCSGSLKPRLSYLRCFCLPPLW